MKFLLDGKRVLSVAWCIWLGVIASMPYTLSFPEPTGAVSFAGAYGFVALGALAGLLASQTKLVRAMQREYGKAWLVISLMGMTLTAILGILEILHLMSLGEVLEYGGSFGSSGVMDKLPAFCMGCLDVASRHERAIAFCLAFACMLCGGFCTEAFPKGMPYDVGSSGKGAPSDDKLPSDALHGESARSKAVAFGLAFVCGILRPYAWLLLYPRPAFPVPMPDGFFSTSDLWVTAIPYGAFVPMALIAVVALVVLRGNSHLLSWIVGGFAVGELAIRALGRLIPELLGVLLWVSAACTIVQTVCAVAVCLLGRQADGPRFARTAPGQNATDKASVAGTDGVPISAEMSLEAFMASIGTNDVDRLTQAGLTPGEVNAVRAAVLGLDSTRTAELLGVQPSTIRTYRRRVCAKLGLESIESLAIDIVRRRGMFAAGSVGEEVIDCGARVAEAGHVSDLGPTMCLFGSLGSLLCLLLPYGSSPMVWTSLQVVAMGVGLGMLLAAGRLLFSQDLSRLSVCGGSLAARASSIVRALSIVIVPVSAFVLAWFHVADTSSVMSLPYMRLAWVVALGACVSHAVVCLVFIACHSAGSCQLSVSVAVGAAGLACAAACSGDAAWLAVFLGCAAVAFVGERLCRSAWACVEEGHADQDGMRSSCWRSGVQVPLLVLCACFGFAWEEIWRGQAYVSFDASCAPSMAVILAVAVWFVRKQLTWWFCVGMIVVLAVVGHALGLCAAFMVCGLCLGLSFVWKGVPPADELGCEGCVPKQLVKHAAVCRISSHCFLTVTCGIGIGVYGVNTFGSFLLRVGSPYPQYQLVLTVAHVILTVVLGVCVLLCVIWMAHDYRCRQSVKHLAMAVTPERLRSYLFGRGIGAARTELVVLLAEGLSVADAALKLGYSRGAADRMRREAFAILGVRTRMQLVSSLTHEFRKTPDK